jgi:hypothetical protein
MCTGLGAQTNRPCRAGEFLLGGTVLAGHLFHFSSLCVVKNTHNFTTLPFAIASHLRSF